MVTSPILLTVRIASESRRPSHVLPSTPKRLHSPAAAEAQPAWVRVATFNASSPRRLEETGDLLASLDAGIICLQEVLVEQQREPRNQAEWLARELGYHCAFNADWRRKRGTGGNAILTRAPLADVAVLTDRTGRRFALTASQEIGGVRLALVTAHCLQVPMAPLRFFRSIPRRCAQMRQLVDWVHQAGLPCIVGGDLNALPYTPEDLDPRAQHGGLHPRRVHEFSQHAADVGATRAARLHFRHAGPSHSRVPHGRHGALGSPSRCRRPGDPPVGARDVAFHGRVWLAPPAKMT